MTMKWATVTDDSPLRIRLDGDSDPLPFTPDSLIDPAALAVDDRVRCELADRRVVIVGRSGGIQSAPAVPAGCVAHTAASTAPSGWLLCDGATVSRTTYSDLFAAIGTTFGAGNGTTTFGLPNLKGRAIVHRDSGQAEFDTLGETGGAKTHTLTGSEMPAHKHDIPRRAYSNAAGSGDAARLGLAQNAANTGTFTDMATTGGGNPHNNLQPYVVLNAIIKT